MNPEQVIRSWLQDYSEGSKFYEGMPFGPFLPEIIDDYRNPFDGMNYELEEVSREQVINSQEPILYFDNSSDCSKKPFNFNKDPDDDFGVSLILENGWEFQFGLSEPNKLGGMQLGRGEDERNWVISHIYDDDTGEIKPDYSPVFFRFTGWRGHKTLLNWNVLPEELV